jgi:hypothetical protein
MPHLQFEAPGAGSKYVNPTTYHTGIPEGLTIQERRLSANFIEICSKYVPVSLDPNRSLTSHLTPWARSPSVKRATFRQESAKETTFPEKTPYRVNGRNRQPHGISSIHSSTVLKNQPMRACILGSLQIGNGHPGAQNIRCWHMLSLYPTM